MCHSFDQTECEALFYLKTPAYNNDKLWTMNADFTLGGGGGV